jgi:hypothetical protein
VNKILRGAICGAGLLGLFAGCNDFLKGGDLSNDPNNPLTATPAQYFGSTQADLWHLLTSDLARLTSMWTQQIVGVQRQQFGIYEEYVVEQGDYDGVFARAYQGGGALDLQKADSINRIFGDSIGLGIDQTVEAWMFSVDADVWGDIPYSQADSFAIYPTPKLDSQQDVYASLQALLSQAIADLQTGKGVGPQGYDLVYGGDPAKWIEFAHTLKARLYLHTAEKVGVSAYASALAEANQGISTNANDYIANFSGSQAFESNNWWQFLDANGNSGRNGDIIADSSYLWNLLQSTSDPRFNDYFQIGSVDTYDFSPFRENPTYPQPYVTYNENLLIKAEAQLQTGNAGAALVSLNTERAAWATATPWHQAYTLAPIGSATLGSIMNEKYIVLFQNIETWNDYKRTCYPQLTPRNGGRGGVIPGRLLYPINEQNTNPNIPPDNAQPARNWNDPNPCPAP